MHRAAVVLGSADDQKGGLEALPLHPHTKKRKLILQELAEGLDPISEHAQAQLGFHTEAVDGVGIHAHSGHADEVALAGPAQCNPADFTCGNILRRAPDVPGQPQLLGQHIARAGRQQRQWYPRAGHAVDHFVDGAVAPAGDNQVAARSHLLAGQRGGAAGAGGGNANDANAVGVEQVRRAVQVALSFPAQPAGEGIIDEGGVAKAWHRGHGRAQPL